jgi:hypothetical protein
LFSHSQQRSHIFQFRQSLSRPFQRVTVESGDSHEIPVFLRRFTVFLTSGALADVGGGRLVESAADGFSPVYR